MPQGLVVTLSVEGTIVEKRSCGLDELGATVQQMAVNAAAFDDISISWEHDQD